MKQIKFSFTDKKLNITLPYDKAEAVMNSPETIVRVMDQGGKWSGITINKSLVMATEIDYEASKQSDREDQWAKDNSFWLKAGEKDLTPEEFTEKWERFKPEFLKKKATINKFSPEELKKSEEELKEINHE